MHVFRRGEHPFAVLLEPDGCDIAFVRLIGGDRVDAVAIDVEEAHMRVANRGKVLFVRRHAKSVHLRTRILQRAVALSRAASTSAPPAPGS